MRSPGGNMSGLGSRTKSIRPACCLILCCLIALPSLTWASAPSSISAGKFSAKEALEKSIAKRETHNSNSNNNNKAGHFAPKLTHQLPNLREAAGKTSSVECPVEAKPEPQVEWFKDGEPLEPLGLMELHGKELMFIQLVANDEGDYHCRATNYLGAVESRPFQLELQRRQDPEIRVEPPQVEAAPKQQAEFTCSAPANEVAQVSWRRNGRPLQRLLNLNQGRFWASRRANEFVLTIKPVTRDDHNSTYTCQLSDESESASPARLLVMQPVSLDEANLAPPMNDLGESLNASKRHQVESAPKRSPPSLRETLNDLYELARPTMLVLGLLLFVSLLSLAQLIYIRRRTRQNRYMKHQLFSSASGSGGSRGSSASGAGGHLHQHSTLDAHNQLGDPNHNCDPVLTSLMARTLSAPSCPALGAAGKRFRSYRDHMRKVAACGGPTAEADLVDAYFSPQQDGQQQFCANLPNLYNQSLAAREQARALLQSSSASAGDHMRSLSNLSQQKSYLLTTNSAQQQQNLGSHLNLPTSENFVQFANPSDQRLLEGLLGAGPVWAQHQNNFQAPASRSAGERQAPPPRQQQDEHYQLVNCSSISPSSTSSVVGYSSNGSSNCPSGKQPTIGSDKLLLLDSAACKTQNLNHYSTIDNNESGYEQEDEENGYEQLQEDGNRRGQRTSTFVADCLRSSSNAHNNSADTNQSLGACQRSSFRTRQTPPQGQTRAGQSSRLSSRAANQQQHDQLSPYAVSSICASLPPVNPNEAMRALSEQFDVSQLMLASENDAARHHNPQLPFDTPLPPPPPPPQTQQQDNQPKRKCHR